ncbi:MAG: DinB family protein [candidate division KSB1 bacterium]|nr:DinB family protein [candidate division KSB1 bacterium]MDZ7364269.1 DinB family protein [candidate division KSB1 bacterium]MDZ7404992.1 DinB family protein [candidate division KSB1 bacterium]
MKNIPPSSTKQRAHILRRLDESLKVLEKSLAGLAEKDWRKKPAPERWSAGEIVHHLVLVEVQRLQMLKELLDGRRKSAPPRAEPIADIASYRYKEQRVPAKEEMQPTPGLSPKILLASFRRGRAETKAFASAADLDKLQNVWLMTKSFGPLNGAEYLEFLAAHTERHADQIQATRKQICGQ